MRAPPVRITDSYSLAFLEVSIGQMVKHSAGPVVEPRRRQPTVAVSYWYAPTGHFLLKAWLDAYLYYGYSWIDTGDPVPCASIYLPR